MEHVRNASKSLALLSELLFVKSLDCVASPTRALVATLLPDDLEEIFAMAGSHHVVMRSFGFLRQILEEERSIPLAARAQDAMEDETRRITDAVNFLERICGELESSGCGVTVIKSLDHWPDLGSDLDLYSSSQPHCIVETMGKAFHAKVAERSWGDRMANKWNFIVPGLRELVEIHVGRLGQMGEQTAITGSLDHRSALARVGPHMFRVAAPEDRIVISTLQRMYRHFYIRLCDVVDIARLVEAGTVDFGRLRAIGMASGLWDGIATYLTIISSYVAGYRGHGIALPAEVTSAARFGIDQIYYGRGFLRVPILPHAAKLYAGELRRLLLNGQVRNSLRLSLLPGLATAAAVEMKLTGSDKGIW